MEQLNNVEWCEATRPVEVVTQVVKYYFWILTEDNEGQVRKCYDRDCARHNEL